MAKQKFWLDMFVELMGGEKGASFSPITSNS